LLVYWGNILMLGVVLYISWFYARCAGLLTEGTTPAVDKAVRRRIVVAQTLYAAGAALCVINTWISIGAIIAVQLNYAIAPTFRAHRGRTPDSTPEITSTAGEP
jgi:uncharacterized membrane protein